MLVLTRMKHESVVIGDEVTLTVEEICDSDGQRIFGARVRLGFQSPPYVSIYRSEWRAKRLGEGRAGGKAKPARPRKGVCVKIAEAQVRLRIQVPQKIPVCCNGKRTAVPDLEESIDGATRTYQAVHHVTCRKEDRITICNNITIATLDFNRFVLSKDP